MRPVIARALAVLASAALLGFLHPALSQGQAFGRKGDPKNVARTIELDMSDAMRFAPAELTVKQGDTVRFRLKNSGQVMHEMVLGTLQDLEAHAQTMGKGSAMHHHDAGNMVHVAPGKTASLVWQFTNAGEFHYGCLVPGHFEAGMRGTINVTP